MLIGKWKISYGKMGKLPNGNMEEIAEMNIWRTGKQEKLPYTKMKK